MCRSIGCRLVRGGYGCYNSPKFGSPGQKGEGQAQTVTSGELIVAMEAKQPTLIFSLLQVGNVITSVDEVYHVEGKTELALTNQCMSRRAGPESEDMNDSVAEFDPATRNCCAGTLVMESGPADNVATECREGELVYNMDDEENDTLITVCHSTSTTIVSEEETSITDNTDFNLASQERATQWKTDFTLNEEPLSRDIRHFSVDEFSVDESGFLSSTQSKMVRNSELGGTYYESDRPHKPQDHQYSSIIDGPIKEPVTGSDALQPCKNTTVIPGYKKPVYPVLVGNSVKVYPTNLFALLPQHDKFLVKERQHDPTGGFTRAKLVLKSCITASEQKTSSDAPSLPLPDHGNDDNDDDVISAYYRQNCNSPSRILYTRDRRFNGRTKYPLPNGRAVNTKIGKGGNGFVFTMYHERKQYAVKKTVYRPNEVNVHSALKHKNILPLLAVLMGERHERHHGKFYCFHFMPQMDCDLRQILSAKDIGCMKYFYRNCSKDPTRWEKGFSNIKFVLAETLEALSYLHSNGYIHRDVKASNIMIKMRCHCRPLECTCSSRFQVKLGDFDSAGAVPGLGITEPTDQVIKFASILPLGTPGYRAPEVSMHIVLSGPYETLYTTAVDMWSFGCLCLNICIGKTAALKQREEASLLLSRTHTCSTELWEKTTKINELKKTKPFCNEAELIRIIGSCLQVNSTNRPTAKDAIAMFRSLMK